MQHILSPNHQLTFAEFFAGIGLMRIGLEEAEWKIKFANDIDPIKQKIYRNHFNDQVEHFHLGDIHRLSGSDIPTVALATASFPCTDLSLAGKRAGLIGRHSSAYWGFIKVIEEMNERRPSLILLENVEGFISSNQGEDLKQALLALNSLGYAVDIFTIDAERFVPQSRVRLFIVGKKGSQFNNIVSGSQLLFYQSELRTAKLADFILSHPEINWDIRHLPSLPKRENTLTDIVDQTPDDNQEWWSEERVNYLLSQTYERHKILLDLAKDKPNYSYFTAFRRVRAGKSMAEIRSDGVAGCLRTPKGGSARQILIRAGMGSIKARLLSPRECAKLMGAEHYCISTSANEALFGFGDAVCVPVVKWIAANYLNPLMQELKELDQLTAIHQSNYEYTRLPSSI
jgi:DNA (cytosine-5)-methyltransferase 1